MCKEKMKEYLINKTLYLKQNMTSKETKGYLPLSSLQDFNTSLETFLLGTQVQPKTNYTMVQLHHHI